MSVELPQTVPVPPTVPASPHEATHDEGHDKRPYIAIFVVLFILTAIEISSAYIPNSFFPHEYVIPVLLILAVAKAALVAAYYMHLRYDPRLLTLIFVGPFFLAILFAFIIIFQY